MPDVCKYARLVSGDETRYITWLFSLNVPHPESGTDYTQVEVKFDSVPYYAQSYDVTGISATGQRRRFRSVGRSFWDHRTIKGLLAWELSQFGEGYEVVDWGGFAVPDDRPA